MPVVPPFLEVSRTSRSARHGLLAHRGGALSHSNGGRPEGTTRPRFRPSISGVAFGQADGAGFSAAAGSLWPVPDVLFPVADVWYDLLTQIIALTAGSVNS